MINLKHELTVDDLIVEYMIYKVNNGYEPLFSTSEFINFLSFFESQMPVKDALYDKEKLFPRFLERKADRDWSNTIYSTTVEKEFNPHMDMIYSKEDNDYLLKANYKLSEYDKSIINTYFMDNGLSRFDYYKGTAAKIRDIIGNYLINEPKRKIDESIDIDDSSLMVGKYIAAEIVKNIWSSYINNEIEKHRWPEQCKDIDKYLLEMDLAQIIGLESKKKELLDFYVLIARRIAILYQQDKDLKFSNSSGSYLARANYNLLFNDYQNIVEIAFGEYKSSLKVDTSSFTFVESHEIDGLYMYDEDADIKTTTSKIGNDKIRKLVRNLDKNIQNN